MPTGFVLYVILAVAGIAALGGAYWTGDTHGNHQAELACARSTATANAVAIEEWKRAADDQRAADGEARKADAARASKAADDAQAIANRFAAMKIAVVKLAPPGTCKLSPEWREAFNGAR